MDLTGATTIGDVLAAIQTASSRLTATVNANGNGIGVVDSTADGGDLQGSSVSSLAADLGLNVTGNGTTLLGTAITGGSVNVRRRLDGQARPAECGTGVRQTDLEQVDLTGATLLASLNQGGGVRRVAGATRITLTSGTTFEVDVTDAATTLSTSSTRSTPRPKRSRPAACPPSSTRTP